MLRLFLKLLFWESKIWRIAWVTFWKYNWSRFILLLICMIKEILGLNWRHDCTCTLVLQKKTYRGHQESCKLCLWCLRFVVSSVNVLVQKSCIISCIFFQIENLWDFLCLTFSTNLNFVTCQNCCTFWPRVLWFSSDLIIKLKYFWKI